jgi:hypothetical protein
MAEAEDAKKALKETSNSALGLAKSLALTKPGLTDFASKVPMVGSQLGAVAKELENQVSQYQVLTKSGINFNGNLSAMITASTQAGLSIKEMTGLVASNSELLAGFGGSVEAGAQGFLKNLQVMNSANNKYGTQLRNIGLTHEEIGEAMMQTQRMAMMSGRLNAATDAEIQQRTAEYAKDLDLLSKLTGKSNDALKKEQAAMQRQGDFRAKTMGMEADMQKSMLNAASEADASGIGDLFKDMMIRGFPSGDQAQLAGMFSNSMGVMKQMKAAQDAGNTAEYDRLKGTLAAAAIKDKSANKEIAILGSTNSASSAVAEAFRKTSESMIGVQAQYERGEITLAGLQKAIQDRRIQAAKEQDAVGGNAEKGGKGLDKVGQEMLGAALRGQETMIRAAAETQVKVTTPMYEKYLGPMFKNLSDSVYGKEGKLIEDISKPMKDMLDAGKAYASGVGGNPVTRQSKQAVTNIDAKAGDSTTSQQDVTRLAELRDTISDLGSKSDLTRDQLLKLVNALNEANKIAAPGSTPITPPLKKGEKNPLETGYGQEGNLPERNKGTPGLGDALGGFKTFAASTENFGKQTLALLHGNELVMTKAQAAELDAGIMALTSSAHSTFANVMKTIQQPSTSQIDGGREVAMLGNAGTGMSQANIQGAVNTLRSPNTQASAGVNMESMKPMMEEMKTSMMAQAEAMKNALPADMFEKMSTAMERTASGIGSQLIEQKNMTKVTKNLGNMGNVFSRGGLNI